MNDKKREKRKEESKVKIFLFSPSSFLLPLSSLKEVVCTA